MGEVVDIWQTLKDEHFSAPRPLAGHTSIRHLWSSNTGGLYVLHFSDGSHYVGRSVSIVRRFAQHRHTFPDIEQISFCRTARRDQPEFERALIHRLQSMGFNLRNKAEVIFAPESGPFAACMPLAEQVAWLEDVKVTANKGQRCNHEQLRLSQRHKFDLLMQIPEIEAAIQVARHYVQTCVPAYIKSEAKFWNVSVLPKTNILIRINIGKQVSFDVRKLKSEIVYLWWMRKNQLEDVIGCDLDDLPARERTYWLVLNEQDGIEYEIKPTSLIMGGPDQRVLTVTRPEQAQLLLSDEIMISAAREFSLNLARLGRGSHGRAHCLDLADRLLTPDLPYNEA
jgi:hypothetical protein